MLEDSDINVQAINIEPTVLIDEASDINYYIGTSKSFGDSARATWRIKRIWQVGTVWMEGYPNGDQGFSFIWDLRTGYVYS
jgi:hypothetical protein